MSKVMQLSEMVVRLNQLGISVDDAVKLHRAAQKLHWWFEKECNGEIERDAITGKPYKVLQNLNNLRFPTRDMELGALKRIADVMRLYQHLTYYIQTDPRGAPLYILRKDDIKKDETVASCYNRGVAVF